MAWHYDERTGNIYSLEEWREIKDRANEANVALLVYLFFLALKISRAAIHFFFGLALISELFFKGSTQYLIDTNEWILWVWLCLSIVHLVFVNKKITWVVNAILIVATFALMMF